MITECPKCKTRYRVNDADIPVGGCPVRCPKCGNVFTIYREPLNIHLEPVVEKPEFVQPKPPPTFEAPKPPPTQPFVKPQPAPAFEQPKPTPQPAKPSSSEFATAAERLKASLGLGGEKDEFPPDWSEEKKNKHRHAKRLARSLARDLLLYHKDKIEKGLAEGNLKDLLGEEIKTSYKFYAESVDPEVLKTTNYFKDALNEIIGKGRKIFI
uniref:Zinc finger/thioredoxin putative domain-containing protein n=1 Tax=candidate division WOR-3 bacterium TaxID=2052148 RepID=A0A7C4U9K4_UNCW3